MEDKEVKYWIRQARHENSMDTHNVEKYAFQNLLTGMQIKLLSKKGPEAEKQLAAVRRMDNFMERLTFKNCIFHFQALTLTAQDKRIAVLEQEKEDLIEELTNLKNNIR